MVSIEMQFRCNINHQSIIGASLVSAQRGQHTAHCTIAGRVVIMAGTVAQPPPPPPLSLHHVPVKREFHNETPAGMIRRALQSRVAAVASRRTLQHATASFTPAFSTTAAAVPCGSLRAAHADTAIAARGWVQVRGGDAPLRRQRQAAGAAGARLLLGGTLAFTHPCCRVAERAEFRPTGVPCSP